MTPEEALQKIALRCRYDLYFLCKYILGYNLMEEHVHADLCRYVESLLPDHQDGWISPEQTTGKGLEDQFDHRNKNMLLLMPRGTFKSSVVTIGFPLQLLLNEPNARILLDSETFSQSKAFLAEIKGHMESNDAYRNVFKAIHGVFPDENKKKRDLTWTDSQIVIAARNVPKKEPTISCAGIDVTKNGMHYDYIICDDLHSEKNVTNKEQIDQVINHWKLAYSLLDPGRPMIIIGTRWDYSDLYQHILDNKRDTYNIMIRRAIDKDGALFFPERLTEKFLKEVKETQGSRIFSSQYLNEPVDDESATFRRDAMIRKEWKEVKDIPMNWYMSVDPSYEGEYSDYAALVIVGMDYQRQLYVRHVTRKKLTYGGIIDEMFNLYAQYQPKQIILETIGAQKSIMHELNNQMKIKSWLPVTEIRSRIKSKEERIRGLAPFYENKRIFHIKECPQLDDYEYELIHFPRGQHDDIVDAVATVLEMASPANPRQRSTETKRRDRTKVKPRSSITGY